MADTSKPAPPPQAPPSSTTSANPPSNNAVRNRFIRSQPTRSNASPSPRPRTSPDVLRRRSSIISDITDDLINPVTSRQGHHSRHDEEVTHWHSTPLAFAILPAIGGLLFKNGSAFVTDLLLLGLAAVFMNWSIRIPWDWYYSAQAVRKDVQPTEDFDIIPEADECAVETAGESSPEQKPADSAQTEAVGVDKRSEAAADLRRQELLALAATFIFPLLAAWLLHVIRAQLSRPSTSLVSDYNLSIFVLAAEIRPVRQLVRLIANRTLHLQRTVTSLDDPFTAALAGEERSSLRSLTSRLADLEARLSDHALIPANVTLAQKAGVSDLSTEIRKRYEPRLEGLERAVRRYEKRSTTLAMLTEQRLNSLEARLQDALSLAAGAAQLSQQRRGFFTQTFETAAAVITWPVKTAWAAAMWPVKVAEEMYERLKTYMLGPMPAPRAAKRRMEAKDANGDPALEEKARVKTSQRKGVR